jgi:dTDP-glucose pyrophosphorylase
MYRFKNQIILLSKTIKDAVRKIETENINLLIVVNKNKKVCGTFTMGDFRRGILKNIDINKKISTLINENFYYLYKGYSKEDAKKIFNSDRFILEIPILDKKFILLDIITQKDVFPKKKLNELHIGIKNTPLVLMAGGKGTRLDPFTRILPKPLIPYGNDAIIISIMDSFKEYGVSKFYISIHDKAEIIKGFFHEYKNNYKIEFIEEKKPLGTASILKNLKKKINKTFFVSNCDILIQAHYPTILNFHKKNKFDLTIVTSFRKYVIPYGICEIDNSSKLINLKEKPEYDFHVNTGLYILEPKLLKLIPNNKKFDMTDLIRKAKSKNFNIGVFPISEKSWKDLGDWSEYSKNTNNFGQA